MSKLPTYRMYSEIECGDPRDYNPITTIYYNPDIFGFLYNDEYTIKELYNLIKKYSCDYNTYKMIKHYRHKKERFTFDFDSCSFDTDVKNTLQNRNVSDIDKMFYCGDVEGKYKEGYLICTYARRKLKFLFTDLQELQCSIQDKLDEEYCVIDKVPSICYSKS